MAAFTADCRQIETGYKYVPSSKEQLGPAGICLLTGLFLLAWRPLTHSPRLDRLYDRFAIFAFPNRAANAPLDP
jgi:hypothetical protein